MGWGPVLNKKGKGTEQQISLLSPSVITFVTSGAVTWKFKPK